jgi:type VI secretion system secreted protein VgrG
VVLETLLHKPAFLQLSPDGSGIHGQIYRAAQGDSGKRLTRYSLTLCPQLAYLAHRINQRIFQNLSVPKIISQVLEVFLPRMHPLIGRLKQSSLKYDY